MERQDVDSLPSVSVKLTGSIALRVHSALLCWKSSTQQQHSNKTASQKWVLDAPGQDLTCGGCLVAAAG